MRIQVERIFLKHSQSLSFFTIRELNFILIKKSKKKLKEYADVIPIESPDNRGNSFITTVLETTCTFMPYSKLTTKKVDFLFIRIHFSDMNRHDRRGFLFLSSALPKY